MSTLNIKHNLISKECLLHNKQKLLFIADSSFDVIITQVIKTVCCSKQFHYVRIRFFPGKALLINLRG